MSLPINLQNRIKRYTYGLKSRVNTGNFSSKEIVIEYVIDEPSMEDITLLKQHTKEEIISEEQEILNNGKGKTAANTGTGTSKANAKHGECSDEIVL